MTDVCNDDWKTNLFVNWSRSISVVKCLQCIISGIAILVTFKKIERHGCHPCYYVKMLFSSFNKTLMSNTREITARNDACYLDKVKRSGMGRTATYGLTAFPNVIINSRLNKLYYTTAFRWVLDITRLYWKIRQGCFTHIPLFHATNESSLLRWRYIEACLYNSQTLDLGKHALP